MTFDEILEMARREELEVSSLPLKLGVYQCETDKHVDKDVPACYVMFFCRFSEDNKDIEIFEFWTACEQCHDVVLGEDENVIR